MNKLIYLRRIILALFLIVTFQGYSITADEVLKKAAATISTTKGLECSFTLSYGNSTTKGTLKASGSNFYISTSAGSSWYNGKSMWTYVPSNNETTVVTPSQSELMEANPMLNINGYSTQYTASFSKTAVKGKYVIELTPKKKTSSVSKVVVTVSSTSYQPQKISINTKGSGNAVLTVASLSNNKSFAASVFEYPKSKYPKAEVVDLR